MKLTTALAALTLLLAGCSSPITVGADYDPSTDFSAYRSYSWYSAPDGAERPVNSKVDNDLLEKRVQAAVERQLTAKGWTKTDEAPSAWVTWHAAVVRRIDMRTVSSDFGYGDSTHSWVREYDEGTLVIDVLDGTSKALIWRGTAQGEVNLFASPKTKEQKINAAVEKLLAPFPPEAE